jgi:endonuclease/exonuclease/phosphatase (EEP) superfamily protein YafD
MKNLLPILKASNNVYITAITLPFLLSFGARIDWRLELLTHFRWQYFVFGLVPLIGAHFLKQKRVFWIMAVVSVIHLLALLPLFVPRGGVAEGETYKIVYFNVNTWSENFEGVQAFIKKQNPDFVLLAETNQRWLNQLEMEAYPYQILTPREDNFGIAFFSKHPFNSDETSLIGQGEPPSIFTEIQMDGEILHFVGTHPVPPVTIGAAERRNIQIAGIFDYVANLDGNILVAGDFNATTWSPYLSKPLAQTELIDSRQGFGIQSSWSTHYPFFLHIPIDHIFVSPEIGVISRELGPELGSDHLPVMMEFLIHP